MWLFNFSDFTTFLKMEDQGLRHQILHRQATCLVFKMFNYLK